MLSVVFVGGFGGGLARYGLTEAWPTPANTFPWSTYAINTSGAFALALLIVVLTEVWHHVRYLRPLLGTGFLGAFTTFSAVTSTTQQLIEHGHGRTAALYVVVSVCSALTATWVGLLLGRSIAANRRSRRPS